MMLPTLKKTEAELQSSFYIDLQFGVINRFSRRIRQDLPQLDQAGRFKRTKRGNIMTDAYFALAGFISVCGNPAYASVRNLIASVASSN